MLKTVLKNWWLDKPIALELGEWECWDKETSAKYPVRFLLQEKLPELYRKHIQWPLDRAYWWVRYRTTHRHYRVIKPRTLEPGYYDERTLILHGAFEVLVEYWEHFYRTNVSWWPTKGEIDSYEVDIIQAKTDKEKEFIQAERDCLADQKAHYDEAHALHIWWTKTRPSRTHPKGPTLPKELGSLGWLDNKHKDDPRVIAYRAHLDEYNKLDCQWEEEDQEMLIRLVKIRQSLWI
ncbi:hypothetical protein LCGC14_0944820 [marine sediment metagenome]|uniref:Uncharacterized protein n=1 Tax=marine sediment metagenome TaxID=412755 RepID=A0A0F9P531_9ZZZZ